MEIIGTYFGSAPPKGLMNAARRCATPARSRASSSRASARARRSSARPDEARSARKGSCMMGGPKLYDPNWDIGIPRNWRVHHTTARQKTLPTFKVHPRTISFFLRTHSNLHSFFWHLFLVGKYAKMMMDGEIKLRNDG